ncbi:MAG: segregation/condensation protein A [Anaerolineales bacterium]|nr:segregation/condensation protein A [Anaerolineales bacterium]
MSAPAWSGPAPGYNVSTPVYDGPLDLLLQLIERAELDITTLALAQVTDQYLAYLHTLDERSAEGVSAFLVIAAKLLQIKSEALLPRPPAREEGEIDLGEELARQLIVYKQFKQLAQYLGQREEAGQRLHLRLAPPPVVEASLDLTGIGLNELIEAARAVFSQQPGTLSANLGVISTAVSLREKIGAVASRLRAHGKDTFFSILEGARSRLEIVVTFLAVLELIKQDMVTAYQERLFGEIEIEMNTAWSGDEDFELEFGE